jgi:hypothetical protein
MDVGECLQDVRTEQPDGLAAVIVGRYFWRLARIGAVTQSIRRLLIVMRDAATSVSAEILRH